MSMTSTSPANSGHPVLQGLIAGTWNIDPAHSTVGFVARHLVVSKVRGRFGQFTGDIQVGANVLSSTVSAAIQMGSIATGDDGRDTHLRSADFFDVEQYPTMTFASTAIREAKDGFVLVGELTIKGVTRAVELELEFDGVQQDPWGGTRAGFSATAEVNRKDWGLGWNVALETGGVLVGEKVKLQLDIQAVRADQS